MDTTEAPTRDPGDEGIAQAQSLHSDPERAAFSTASGGSSVTPSQIIYESTRLVTWRARAGSSRSDGGMYTVLDLIDDIRRRKVDSHVVPPLPPLDDLP